MGIGREVVDLMEGKKLGVLCLQKTRLKGQKTREMDKNV